MEWGRPKLTKHETAEIQAGRTFSLAIPHYVTASLFFQTGGNNGPVQLGFLVREPNMLQNQAGVLAKKNQAALRSWWIRDLFDTGGLRGNHFSKDLSPKCKWGG